MIDNCNDRAVQVATEKQTNCSSGLENSGQFRFSVRYLASTFWKDSLIMITIGSVVRPAKSPYVFLLICYMFRIPVHFFTDNMEILYEQNDVNFEINHASFVVYRAWGPRYSFGE